MTLIKRHGGGSTRANFQAMSPRSRGARAFDFEAIQLDSAMSATTHGSPHLEQSGSDTCSSRCKLKGTQYTCHVPHSHTARCDTAVTEASHSVRSVQLCVLHGH